MEDQLEHYKTLARMLDQQNQQLQAAFNIMYQHLFLKNSKTLTKSEREFLVRLRYVNHFKNEQTKSEQTKHLFHQD